MNNFRDAFRRAAKNNPAFDHFQLYREAVVDVDLSDVPEDERNLYVAQEVVWDWVETLPGALEWRDVGLDGKGGAYGVLTLYGSPVDCQLALGPSGEWYVVKETLGADTLGAGYKLAVGLWVQGRNHGPPVIRVQAP